MTTSSAPADFPRTYQNSSDGLRWQLQDILNTARHSDDSRLESLIRQMEIPDSKEWFAKVFGREAGENWAHEYESNLGEKEKYFRDILKQLAGGDGEFSIRVVNDGPASTRKIEGSMVHALQRPVKIYFAGWMERRSWQGPQPLAIGYFVFIDGKFCLDSAVNPLELNPAPGPGDADEKTAAPTRAAGAPGDPSPMEMENGVYRPGAGGVGYPVCDHCPDPHYTKLARKKKLEGTVVLQVVVQADGGVTDIQLVKSPDQELTNMAIEAVKNWHLSPAHLAGGEPVPVTVPIQVTFRLLK